MPLPPPPGRGPPCPRLRPETGSPPAWQKAEAAQIVKLSRIARAFPATGPAHPAPGSKAARWTEPTGAISILSAPLTLTVTNTNDSGPGSLREAVAQANANPGSTIRFGLPSYPATITLTSGGLSIHSDMTIEGPGAFELTVSGGFNFQIFDVGRARVTISGLFLTLGSSDGDGGTISNRGVLTLENCSIETCTAADRGGAVYNGNELTLKNCGLSDNQTGQGGAVEHEGAALTIVNSSFIFNQAVSDGGALSLDGLSCTMTNDTVAGNKCDNGDGGVWGAGVEAKLLNSIVAYNNVKSGDGIDWYGRVESDGHNIIDYIDDIAQIDGPATGDQHDIDPRLAYPELFGGPSRSAMPLPGSPAIDAGDDSVLGPPRPSPPISAGPAFRESSAGTSTSEPSNPSCSRHSSAIPAPPAFPIPTHGWACPRAGTNG